MPVLRAYKFRIYPTKAQRTKMGRTLDLCRWAYNKTLEIRKTAMENEGNLLESKTARSLDIHDLEAEVGTIPLATLRWDSR